MELPLIYAGVPSKERSRRAEHALERTGLADRMDHKPNELSGGQRQRVALARALAAEPDLILADEPTASLDAEAGSNAMNILKELCRQLDKTVIVVTHASRIFPMADRILQLIDGQVAPDVMAAEPPHHQNMLSSPVLAGPRTD